MRTVLAGLLAVAMLGLAGCTESTHLATRSSLVHGPDSVVGVWWRLQEINGQPAGSAQLWLDVAVDGTFQQQIGGCQWIDGQLAVAPKVLHLRHVRDSIANCALVLPVGDGVVDGLHRLLQGHVDWSASQRTLTLSRAGLRAVYAAYPRSESPSKQWTFHGVGISVPASWPRWNAACGTPHTGFVLYPSHRCAASPDPATTTVEFSRIAQRDMPPSASEGSPIQIDGVAATERLRRTDDGRQIYEVQIPDRNVAVTITSPDSAFAVHLGSFEIFLAQR